MRGSMEFILQLKESLAEKCLKIPVFIIPVCIMLYTLQYVFTERDYFQVAWNIVLQPCKTSAFFYERTHDTHVGILTKAEGSLLNLQKNLTEPDFAFEGEHMKPIRFSQNSNAFLLSIVCRRKSVSCFNHCLGEKNGSAS